MPDSIENSVDIEKYIEGVDYLAKIKSEFQFKNYNTLQANIIISKIIEYSKQEVRIYEDSITGDIADLHKLFEKTLDWFFLDKKVLKIVVRKETTSDCDLIDKLGLYSEQYPDQLQVKIANESFKQNVKDAFKKDVNFTVNDNSAFRLEILNDEIKNSKEAICSFNYDDVSAKLIDVFDRNFDNCIDYKLPIPHLD